MKYDLVGQDGNAYAIMGYTQRCMRAEKFTKEEIDAYLKEATSGDYNHLLATSYEFIDQCNNRFLARDKEV